MTFDIFDAKIVKSQNLTYVTFDILHEICAISHPFKIFLEIYEKENKIFEHKNLFSKCLSLIFYQNFCSLLTLVTFDIQIK